MIIKNKNIIIYLILKKVEVMKTVVLFKKCNGCQKSFPLKVEESDLNSYRNETFVQEDFPYLSVGDRELIISSTCSECFDEMFGMFE